MLAAVFDRTDQSQRFVTVDPCGQSHFGEFHPAGGDGAGLVEQNRVDPASGFQNLRALDQESEASATTPKLKSSRLSATSANDLRWGAASPNQAWLS